MEAYTAEKNKEMEYSPIEEWNRNVGLPSTERYESTDSVPEFDRTLLQELQRIPCHVVKLHWAPSKPLTREISRALELINLDISGKVQPRLSGTTYTVAVLDDCTATSYDALLKKKSELAPAQVDYKNRAEFIHKPNGFFKKKIGLERAGENLSTDIQKFYRINVIQLEASPAHASKLMA